MSGTHPESCRDPETCGFSTYREHLLSVGIAASSLPSRSPRAANTAETERRWNKDMPAFKRLVQDGHTPPQIDGAAYREQMADESMDVIDKPMEIDWNNHGGDKWLEGPAQYEVPYP